MVGLDNTARYRILKTLWIVQYLYSVDWVNQVAEAKMVEVVTTVAAARAGVEMVKINTQDSKRFDFHRTCNHDSNNTRITFYLRNIRNLHSSFQYNKNYRTNHPYLHFPMSKRYMESVIYL